MIICANLKQSNNELGFLLPANKINKLDVLMKAENSLTQFHWEFSKKSTSFHSTILIITDIEVNY